MNEIKNDFAAVVTCEITSDEILKMRPDVPFEVQIRFMLNKCGFKFKDDSKASSVINKNPDPLGKFTSWQDFETGSVHFKQILDA